MANGKVCTGFSKPYVANYAANGGIITYSNGRTLARGVNVTLSPNSSDDNNFYADNQLAESASGAFTGGSVSLTVDGLFRSAERMIMGLPAAGADGFIGYGDEQNVPNVGIGYIARYMSDGVTTYVPTVLVKAKFNLMEQSAATQESEISWQTQALTATLMRGDDANHNWKYIGKEYGTEAEAERALQVKLGINLVNPVMMAEGSGATLFGTRVSDIQNDVHVGEGVITGTLYKLDDPDASLVETWGEGYFVALKFTNIDSRATSVRVGLDPSQSSGLVEIIDDPDKNGVFKITNKDTQVFEIISSDGSNSVTTTYDLTGLVLDPGV